MDSVIKKTRKINHVSFDVWVNIIEFSTIKEFFSLTLVVKGLKDYIKRIRPQSLNHLRFRLKKFPLNPQEHTRYLFIPSFMKLDQFNSMFVVEIPKNGKYFIHKRKGANMRTIFNEIRKYFPNLYNLRVKGTLPDVFRSEKAKDGEKSEKIIKFDFEFPFLEKLSFLRKPYASSISYDIQKKFFKKKYYYKSVAFCLDRKYYPRLKELKLQYYYFKENGINGSIIDNLTRLVLDGCKLNQMIDFSKCRFLKYLELESIEPVFNTLPFNFNIDHIGSLECLIIRGISIEVFISPIKIKNLPKLRKLYLNIFQGEMNLETIVELSSLPELRELFVDETPRVDFLDSDHGEKLEKLRIEFEWNDMTNIDSLLGSAIRKKLESSGYKNLKEIKIFIDNIRSTAKVNLANLDKLRVVDIEGLNIGNIKNCGNLEIMRYSGVMGGFTEGKYSLDELILTCVSANGVKAILLGSPDFFVKSLKVYNYYDGDFQFKLERDLLKLLVEKCGCFEVLDSEAFSSGLDRNVVNPLFWS